MHIGRRRKQRSFGIIGVLQNGTADEDKFGAAQRESLRVWKRNTTSIDQDEKRSGDV